MKKKLILHVGTEKTGSTSIQHVLSENRQLLREKGIVFPKCLGPTNHTLLVSACLDDGVFDNIKTHHLTIRKWTEEDLRNEIRDSLEKELRTGLPWSTLVVSSELIHSRLTEPTEIKRLFSFLSPYVDEIQVCLFLRRQDDLAVSRYSSVLRTGHSGFDDILRDIGDHKYLSTTPDRNVSDFDHYFDYRRLIERFREHVSHSEMIVRVHSDHLQGTGVVGEFARQIGIDPAEIVLTETNLNPAMSAGAQFIISSLNADVKPLFESGQRNAAYKKLQAEIEAENSGEKRTVSRADAEEFFNRFAESNEWVRINFFPEKDTLFDLNFSAYPQDVDYGPLRKELASTVSRYRDRARLLPKQPPRPKAGGPKRRSKFFYIQNRIFGALEKFQRARISPLINRIRHISRILGCIQPVSTENSKRLYEFAIVRILGNDHFPRHSTSQTLTNLLFILDHEPEFKNCKKFFVVNRIFDRECESEIMRKLDSRGFEYIHIPFEPAKYARTDWDMAPFGDEAYFESMEFRNLPPEKSERIISFAAAPKIRYAMNVNGARNAALQRGMAIADWILPLDGNCILTQTAFELLRKSAVAYPHVPYLLLPMKRLLDNKDFFTSVDDMIGSEEPQIAIHRSATEGFDLRFPYGFRDKAELFARLGVPGAWNHWEEPFWLPRPKHCRSDRFLFKRTRATILRLSSGNSSLDSPDAQVNRHRSRFTAVLNTLEYLDRKYGCRNIEIEKRLAVDSSPRSLAENSQPNRNQEGSSKSIPRGIDTDSLSNRTFFVGLGAMKAGTSWLSSYLAANPSVFHSPIKEMNFFNKLIDNPLRLDGPPSLLNRLEAIVLNKAWDHPPQWEQYETLKSIAELAGIRKSIISYREYFARRIGRQNVFGEFSPSYALLPPKGYANMLSISQDLRLLFIMRDPADRAASNIQHLWRRSPETPANKIIAELAPGNRIYERSNYRRTIEAVKEGAPMAPFLLITYEHLFVDETIDKICAFLGIPFLPPNYEKRENPSRGPNLSAANLEEIRERLDPIYTSLRLYLGDRAPSEWRW